jgi:hypothetical protein
MWCPAPTLAERTHPRMRKRVQDKVVVWQAFVALVGRGGGENSHASSHVCCEVLLTLYADKALPCVSVCAAACMMAHRFVEVALLALNELIEHSTGGAGSKGAPNATGRGGASQGGQGGVDAATLERFEEHVERLVRVACACVAREPALLVDDKHRACVGATHGSKRCYFVKLCVWCFLLFFPGPCCRSACCWFTRAVDCAALPP